jgi:hypothetical protein
MSKVEIDFVCQKNVFVFGFPLGANVGMFFIWNFVDLEFYYEIEKYLKTV